MSVDQSDEGQHPGDRSTGGGKPWSEERHQRLFAKSMTPQQCRMARAALDWSREDLAKHANLKTRAVVQFEDGAMVSEAKFAAIKEALMSNGVRFVSRGRMAGGVYMSRPLGSADQA